VIDPRLRLADQLQGKCPHVEDHQHIQGSYPEGRRSLLIVWRDRIDECADLTCYGSCIPRY
jgi:hypothetical protein